MGKRDRNKQIINRMKQKIDARGLGRRLQMYPIETPYTRRPSYWRSKDGKFMFSAHMWQLNELDNEELEIALDSRIEAAIRHFGLGDVIQPISFETSLIEVGQ